MGRGNTQFQRLTGGSASGVSGQVTTDTQGAATKQLKRITSLFDLTTQQVSVPVKDGAGQTTYQTIPNPLMDPSQAQTFLPLLFAKTTRHKQSHLTPRLNVTTADAAVLAMLPNLQQSDVELIVAGQPPLSPGDAPDPIYQTPARLLPKTTTPFSTLSALETY